MYTRILNIWSNFRNSFWFIPSLLMILAAISAFGMIAFDRKFAPKIVEHLPLLEMSPPAARSILSSIVSAMVSTTGVVFSITIVALSLSSSHFGSRLIRTYRKRKTTHFTLGIFVSTSLFCILVLASIRELDEIQFVPLASVATGIVLSVVCMAMLVYYIHDMSRAIEAPNVIQQSAIDLHDAIERLVPDSIGQPNSKLEPAASLPAKPAFEVLADHVGYLQAIQNETLMTIAKENNLVVKLLVRPGDFLFDDVKVADVYSRNTDETDNVLDKDSDFQNAISKAIVKSMIVGPERTHIQDVRHAFDEVVEIAVRALSPGINDPYTAINCVDRILAALRFLKSREMPATHRFDNHGQLRVIGQPTDLEECIQGSLGVIHNYACDSILVKRRIEQALESLEA